MTSGRVPSPASVRKTFSGLHHETEELRPPNRVLSSLWRTATVVSLPKFESSSVDSVPHPVCFPWSTVFFDGNWLASEKKLLYFPCSRNVSIIFFHGFKYCSLEVGRLPPPEFEKHSMTQRGTKDRGDHRSIPPQLQKSADPIPNHRVIGNE